jgi:dTDP-4-dehydrorhamnose reductase
VSRVIVFGASGLLGASLVPALEARGHAVLAQGRGAAAALRLDPLDADALSHAFALHQPTALVNLIAATNVDQCEEQPLLAYRANVAVVEAIANAVARQPGPRPHLVHVSTDQVYDGPGPHAEDVVQPINVYGLSKYAGELVAERVGATVLRTNFFGRSRCAARTSFSDWLVASLREGKPITVFDDVLFSALHLHSLCDVIAAAIEHRPAGVFNAGCRDGLSKAGFALSLARKMALPTTAVRVGTSADVALRARRPLDMTLDVSRIERALKLSCPSMDAEIERTAKEYSDVQAPQ